MLVIRILFDNLAILDGFTHFFDRYLSQYALVSSMTGKFELTVFCFSKQVYGQAGASCGT